MVFSSPMILLLLPLRRFSMPVMRLSFPETMVLRLPVMELVSPQTWFWSPRRVLPIPVRSFLFPERRLLYPRMMFYYPFRKLPLGSGGSGGREDGLIFERSGGGVKGRRVMVSQWTLIARVQIMSSRRKSVPLGCGIPSMLYKLFHHIEYSPYQLVISSFELSPHPVKYPIIFLYKLFMRAYAIVRKPPPALQEHVIKLTKEEPKISIDGISENRLASPHKTGVPLVHELHNSGAYFKFSNEDGEKESNRSRKPQEQPPSERAVSQKALSESYPQVVVNQQPLPSKPIRTKKLFQELPPSPSKPREEEEPRQDKVHATPVKLLQADVDKAVLPIQSVVEGHHRKVRIFEHSRHSEVEIVSGGQRENIIYQTQSKSVFCCGEVSVQSNKDHNQQQQQEQLQEVPQMVFSKPPPQLQTEARHQSSKKRRIFQEFEQKDRVVQQFTFKDQRLSNRNMEKEVEKSIRIKIFQFAPIPPFDI